MMKMRRREQGLHIYSQHGVRNIEAYEMAYSDFVEWCKSNFKSGTFSTYTNGEPVFFSLGAEISYSQFKNCNHKKNYMNDLLKKYGRNKK